MHIISTTAHAVLDYLVGILLIAAPWILGFAGPNVATYVPVTLGAITIIYSMITDYEGGIWKLITMRRHLLLDILSALLLALSPWLFNFSDYIYVPHLAVGILELLIIAMTNPVPYRVSDDLPDRTASNRNKASGQNTLSDRDPWVDRGDEPGSLSRSADRPVKTHNG